MRGRLCQQQDSSQPIIDIVDCFRCILSFSNLAYKVHVTKDLQAACKYGKSQQRPLNFVCYLLWRRGCMTIPWTDQPLLRAGSRLHTQDSGQVAKGKDVSTIAVLTQVFQELKEGRLRVLLHVAGVWTSAAAEANWLWWMTTTLCRYTVCRPKHCCLKTAMPTASLGTQSLRTCCASQAVASCPPKQQTSHCTSRKCRYNKLLRR